MRQFKKWTNNLEKDPVKPTEEKHTITKIEYKVTERVEKQIATMAYNTKMTVTKDYHKRAQMKPFGIGTTMDDLKANSVVATLQRENVWHPYYEINLDEMDFKEKMMAAAETKKLQNPGGMEIDEIQKQLINHDQDVQRATDDPTGAVAAKRKPGFNLQDKLAALKMKDAEEEQKQVIDPYTVKVRKIYRDVTVEDLEEMMKTFGEVTRCNIPMDETGGYKGLAFVTFKRAEDCTKCIEQGYIQFEFSELPCDRAMQSNKRAMEMRERNERRRDFGDRDREGGFRGGREGGFRGGRGGYGDREGGGFRGGREGGRDGYDRDRRPMNDEPLRRRKD